MASKRFGNVVNKNNNYAPSKRQKMDLQVFNSQQWSQHKKNEPQQARHQANLWGDDDDDDFIVIASQKADKILSQSVPDTTNMDLTYGRFSKDGNMGGASTQNPGPLKPKIPVNDEQILLKDVENLREAFTGDFDDDCFDNISQQANGMYRDELNDEDPPFYQTQFKEQQRKNKLLQTGGTPNDFKIPKPIINPPKATPIQLINQPGPSGSSRQPASRSSVVESDKTKAAQQKERAKDLQLNYLQSQIAKYTKKNEELKKTSTDANEQLLIREGEVNMLRYELKSTKKLNEDLRLEKMSESETIKKEWMEKMKDLEREIKRQKALLDYKDLEIMNQARPKGINTSVGGVSTKQESGEKLKVCFTNLILSDCPIFINRQMFEPSTNELRPKQRLTARESALLLYLSNFQSLLAMLVTAKETGAGDENDTNRMMFENSKKFILDFRMLTQGLNHVKYTDLKLNPTLEYKFLYENSSKNIIQYCPQHLKDGLSIFGKSKMFPNEKAHTARRILAAISIALKHSPPFYQSIVNTYVIEPKPEPTLCPDIIVIDDDEDEPMPVLIEEKNLEKFLRKNCKDKSRYFLDVLTDILNEISFSKELPDYNGVLMASAEILKNISQHLTFNWESRKQLQSCLNLLKAIVFCRPDNLNVIYAVSQFLCKMAHTVERRDFLNFLCCNSAAALCFKQNDVHKIIQFSKDSCVLQIYGALLEVSVSQLKPLNYREATLLYQTLHTTIKFIRKCMTANMQWVTKFTKASSTCPCHCYIRVATAFVVLFYLFFKLWLQNGPEIDDSSMQQIAQPGVLVLYDIFHKHYQKELLQIGGNTIKSYLQILHNWLSEYADVLELQAVHRRALDKMDLRLVIPDLLRTASEDIVKNINSQVDEQLLIESFENMF